MQELNLNAIPQQMQGPTPQLGNKITIMNPPEVIVDAMENQSLGVIVYE